MTMSFEEARVFWEVHMRDVDAALKTSVRETRVAVKDIHELHRTREEYVARLGDQPDPYLAFRDHQSSLLRIALTKHGTPEGRQALLDYKYNEANPAPVGNAR